MECEKTVPSETKRGRDTTDTPGVRRRAVVVLRTCESRTLFIESIGMCLEEY